MPVVKVAAVQASPVYYDLAKSLEKAILFIKSAAGQGAQVVAFPETFLPGYPAFADTSPGFALWQHKATKELYARMMENSIAVPSAETEALSRAAKDHSIVVCIGCSERVSSGPGRGTLYNTQLTFGADGQLMNTHRKVMPTMAERMWWGQGDGGSLHAVQTAAGRVGALICWEHWMPLTRAALHATSEDIHVAAWPRVTEMNLLASRHYAAEGRCFVIAVGALLHRRDLALADSSVPPEDPDALLFDGGTTIIGPDGRILVGPVMNEETLVFAELDFSRIAEESLALDVTGHYSRPDIFQLTVNGKNPLKAS